jgi:hypothetical protein
MASTRSLRLVVDLLQKCNSLPECVDNMLAVSMFVKTWVYSVNSPAKRSIFLKQGWYQGHVTKEKEDIAVMEQKMTILASATRTTNKEEKEGI